MRPHFFFPRPFFFNSAAVVEWGGKNYKPMLKTYGKLFGSDRVHHIFFPISSWTPKSLYRFFLLRVRGSLRAGKMEEGTEPSPGPFAKTLNIEGPIYMAAYFDIFACQKNDNKFVPATKITNMKKTINRLEMSSLTRTKLLCFASTKLEKCSQQTEETCNISVSAAQ